MKHHITTSKEQRLDRADWWRAVCSCGKYQSKLYGSPGGAERAGDAHAATKNKQEGHT